MKQVLEHERPPADPPARVGESPTRAGLWMALGGLSLIAILGLTAIYAGWFSSDEATAPSPTPAIADGTWFAMTSVGTDESGAVTLGVDLAEILSGEPARLAAIEDGVIAEGEELPNDVYIRNPTVRYELINFAEGVEVTVVSAVEPGTTLAISPEKLEALYAGRQVDETIYGIAKGTPIAMNVTIADGLVSEAQAVYLP